MDQAAIGSLVTSHGTDWKTMLSSYRRLLVQLFPPVHRVERTTHRRKRQEPRSGPAPSRSATRFFKLLYSSHSYTLINFILCTRLYNIRIHHVADPPASTAACNASIGPTPDICAIATIGAALGHQWFCVRTIVPVRTFSRRTRQPVVPVIGRSDCLPTLHSIRPNEP